MADLMSTYGFSLDVTVQADSLEEARELRDESINLLATHDSLHPSVLSVSSLAPRPVTDRRVPA